MVRKILLTCGIVAALLYVVTTILGAMRYPGYSSTAHSVSELFAIDAPSKPFVDPLFVAYSLLWVAFGVGVWQSAGRNRALRIAADARHLAVLDQVAAGSFQLVAIRLGHAEQFRDGLQRQLAGDLFDEVARQRTVSNTLLKRTGEPQDIARAVHYLIADAPYVTGQIIAVDGGRSINL